MTNPSFEARYQLLKCVAVADGIRTHNALETSSGRVVMVHLLDAAGPDEVDSLRAQLALLTDPDKARVLELATLPAGFALVTEFLQGLTSFTNWLDTRVARLPPTDAVRTSEVSTPQSRPLPIEPIQTGGLQQEPGDFTRLFGQAALPLPQAQPVSTPTPLRVPAPPPPAPAPPAPTPPSPAATPAMDAPRLEAGEFTELFQPRVAPSPKVVASSPLAAPPPAMRSPQFGLRDAGIVTPPREPRASSPFGVSPGPTQPPPASSLLGLGESGAPPRPLPTSQPFNPPGLAPPHSSASPFGRGDVAGAGTSPQAAPHIGSPLPPVLGEPHFGMLLPPVLAPPRFDPLHAGSPLSPVGAAAAAPASDYTLVIQQSKTPHTPVASAGKATPMAPAPRKRSIPLGLIVALNLVLVLAVVLVVYFIFRPASNAVTPEEGLPDVPKAMPKAPPVPKLPTAPKLPKI